MKGAVQDACLSPPYDAHGQGPPEEVTGGKTQGKSTEFVRELKRVVLTNLRTWKGEK